MDRAKWDAINIACYEQYAEFWNRFPFKEELPQWVYENRPSSQHPKALDIGSGTGVLAKWLVKQGYQVTCFDPTAEMVRRCREKKLDCQQTTLQEFQTDQTFDAIFAILSLIHIQKRELPLQLERIAGWLSSNGFFYVGLLGGKGEGLSPAKGMLPRCFSYFTKEEFIKLASPHFSYIKSCEFKGGETTYLLMLFQKRS